MVNISISMNLQWSSPAPRVRTARVAHKRLDSDDQPPAKCARLSADAGDTQGLLGTSPGSPVSPVSSSSPTTHQGPSRIGPFLLLPLTDRESVHSAMNTDTGDEQLCKVFDMGVYQEKIRAYGILPAHENVAGVRDIIIGERRAYVFLDKDFGDMHTLVKSCRRLDEERARRLFRQAAVAVAHCHQAGIVLGDLKLRKFVFADEKSTFTPPAEERHHLNPLAAMCTLLVTHVLTGIIKARSHSEKRRNSSRNPLIKIIFKRISNKKNHWLLHQKILNFQILGLSLKSMSPLESSGSLECQPALIGTYRRGMESVSLMRLFQANWTSRAPRPNEDVDDPAAGVENTTCEGPRNETRGRPHHLVKQQDGASAKLNSS